MLLLNFYQTPELLISESHGTSCTSRFIDTSILRVPGKDYSSPKSLGTNSSEFPMLRGSSVYSTLESRADLSRKPQAFSTHSSNFRL